MFSVSRSRPTKLVLGMGRLLGPAPVGFSGAASIGIERALA
jgi:hypothetical protein